MTVHQHVVARKPATINPTNGRRCSCVPRCGALHSAIPVPGSSALEDLIVEAVEPDPDATRLRVVISVPSSCDHPVATLKQRLDARVGLMRAEVAAQINRKRVPLLTISLIPREGEI